MQSNIAKDKYWLHNHTDGIKDWVFKSFVALLILQFNLCQNHHYCPKMDIDLKSL